MKSHTHYLLINTAQRQEFRNITADVEAAVRQSGVKEGLVLVNPMHITSAVFVNDAESGLLEDFAEWLEELAPTKPDYAHHKTGEDNADAHLKRTLMGHQVTMAITDGSLDLGPWEQIYYAEFDGIRDKRVLIKIIGE
ncbi:MAG: secondary thiamine-phosphate synthase enzyme YjbQ [archaeon]